MLLTQRIRIRANISKLNWRTCVRRGKAAALFSGAILFLMMMGQVPKSTASVLSGDYATGVTDVAAFPTADGFQHAFALHAGVLTEMWFGKGQGQDDVAEVPGAFASSAYEGKSFGSRLVLVVLQNDGDVVQTWFRSDGAVGSRVIGGVSGSADVAAFEDQKGTDHIVVLQGDGEILEFTTKGSGAITSRTLALLPGVGRIAAFQDMDDHECVVIVLFTSGEIEEISYAPGGNPTVSPVLASQQPLGDIAAFYTPVDHMRHVITLDGMGVVRDVSYPSGVKPQDPVTMEVGVAEKPHKVAGYSTTDNWRHVILGGTDGQVRELAFSGNQRTNSPLGSFSPAQPSASFVGPAVQMYHDTKEYDASPTGLTYALAGTEATRYAVSLNGGVWRSSTGLPWVSLKNSSRYAHSIAVDPNDVSHVFVGDRDGDAGSPQLNQAGLWESTDLGETWGYALNPLALQSPNSSTLPPCQFQGVPAIWALEDGGALAATQCVIVRRHGRSGVFEPLVGFWGLGAYTAVATTNSGNHQWIWARTATQVCWSSDDGQSVSCVPIPTQAPDAKGVQRAIEAKYARGEDFGFAAYGSRVALVERADIPGTPSPRVASLEFDAVAGTWEVDTVNVGAGVGLGGRLFIRADTADAYTRRTGQKFALLMSGSETLFLGTPRGDPESEGSERGIEWRPVAESHWNPGAGDHYLLSTQSAVHTDFWDAHISQNPADAMLLIACDGGVFSATIGNILSTSPKNSPAYGDINDGMFTQHIQSMAIVDPSYAHRSAVLTAAVDNDAWWMPAVPFAEQDRPWGHDNLGDGNFLFVDPSVTEAAADWRHRSANGLVRDLTAKTPGHSGSVTAYPYTHFRSEHQYAVMMRENSDAASTKLYMAALGRKAKKLEDDTNAFSCDGSPTKTAIDGSSWDSVLFQTEDYANHRSIYLPNGGSGWSLLGGAPHGAQRLWAAGERNSPTFYVYSEDDSTGALTLWQQQGKQGTWEMMTGITSPLFQSPYCAVHGPLFPDPYDASLVYAIAQTGIWKLSAGTFAPDNILTALLTRSGTFPITDSFPGATATSQNGDDTLALHVSQARPLSTLVDMSVDDADPYRVVVASAFGSVFFQDRREGFWRDLTPFLPTPTPAISSVAIAHDGVFVGFEGRSVWKISLPEIAPEASFFDGPGFGLGLAILRDATGTPMAGVPVSVTVPATPLQPGVSTTVITRADGSVPYPPGTTATGSTGLEGNVIRLVSVATIDVAPASKTFVLENAKQPF
jgi:hypothetical protein